MNAKARKDPDADLVRGLKERRSKSYELLLERYQTAIYTYTCRLLGESAEAEDVTQDIFVKVFRKVGGFRGASTFKTWLYRIATNEASNRRRWYSRHRWREINESALHGFGRDLAREVRSPGATPFDHVCELEGRETVRRALLEINPRFRPVVVLRDLEGFTYAEIASMLGIPLGTVKSRILRGREALKRQLLRRAAGPAAVRAR